MNRSLLPALLLLLAGCAPSAEVGTASGPASRGMNTGTGGDIYVANSTRAEEVTVAAQGGGTTLRTTVTATARPNQGTSASVLGCSCTGRLETRINQLLQQRLNG